MIDLKQGLYNLRKDLLDNGYEIETERWQGGTDHPGFLEILHADMQAQMYDNKTIASANLKASQPWADIHFQERVGIYENVAPADSRLGKKGEKTHPQAEGSSASSQFLGLLGFVKLLQPS